MKKVNLLILTSLTVLLFSSCATIFTGTRSTITVRSEPSHAEVSVDGLSKGTTPATFKVKRGLSPETVTLSKDGYDSKTFSVQQDFNAISIINLLCIPCWAVDLATGSAMKVSQKNYTIKLDQEKE